MQISHFPTSTIPGPLKLNQPAPQEPPAPTGPDLIDTISDGVSQGANFANGTIGAWNGMVAGAVTGTAISLGGSAISALAGSSQMTVETLLRTAGSAGLWAAGGAVVGGVAGGLAGRGLGNLAGNAGASAADALGLPESVGRAAGTVATGVALGSLLGLGVAGPNGAYITLGFAAAGGVMAGLNAAQN